EHLQLPMALTGTALHPRDLDVWWLELPALREVDLRFEGTHARLELRRNGVTVHALRGGEALHVTVPRDESVLAVLIPEPGASAYSLTATVGGPDDHSDDVPFAT